jgi:hypothetical protein
MEKHIAELPFFLLIMLSKSLLFLKELNEELLLLYAHTLSKS